MFLPSADKIKERTQEAIAIGDEKRKQERAYWQKRWKEVRDKIGDLVHEKSQNGEYEGVLDEQLWPQIIEDLRINYGYTLTQIDENKYKVSWKHPFDRP